MSHGTHREADAPAVAVREAETLADEADARSGIVTRPATTDELDGVLARFESTWGPGRGADRSMLQALDHAGNTVLVAVPAPGRVDAAAELAEPGEPPIGATLGFLGWNGGAHLHSHMNAVAPQARGRGIGVALKLRQRAVCLAHGIDEIRWTYDPLIRRNARMNLVRLGAEVVRFLPDFYGELADAISGGDRSDRFEVRWRLTAPRVQRALAGEPAPEWTAEGGLALVPDFEDVRAGECFGVVREWVDCGVSVGIAPSVDELLDEVRGYLDQGYRRIKLKIKPGWDLVPVGAVRELLGPRGLLQVDANTAYTREDIPLLASLDPFELLLVEQPFAETDLGAHIALAAASTTPVCLDESILDVTTAVDAIERGATSIVNIKAGRMGGYLEALRVHDACRGLDIPVWCGGMLETGVGRAANVALAALPGFLLPGDTSASSRYFAEDLTEPFELGSGEHRGQLRVPDAPGTGVRVREELVREWASAPVVTIRPR